MTSSLVETDLESRLGQVISNIRNLPTPPIVFEQIQKKINDPDVAVSDIAAVLAEDPAMSVKVLKMTNSTFYGLSRKIESVGHATMIIGLEAVKNLVLSASVLGMFKSNKSNKEFQEEFWRHSLATALVARMIAQEYKGGNFFNPDTAFTSGLIHDIGKMVICCFLSEQFEQIQQYQKENPQISDDNAETIILGYNHAQLGRQLAKTWKLPDRVAACIGYHHQPGLDNESDNYAYLINLANYITYAVNDNDADEEAGRPIPEETFEFFEIDKTYIDGFQERLIEEYMKAETFMSIAGLD